MGYKSANEVLRDIVKAITEFPEIRDVEGFAEGPLVKYKLILDRESFVQIYYNEVSGTTAYAYVRGGKRLFGIDFDSIRGWHKHPFNEPSKHEPHVQTSLLTFLKELVEVLMRNQKDEGAKK